MMAKTLDNLESLASVDGLSRCPALQTLEFIDTEDMDKITSMPDLSSIIGLKVTGLPPRLQKWDRNGRKSFPAGMGSILGRKSWLGKKLGRKPW